MFETDSDSYNPERPPHTASYWAIVCGDECSSFISAALVSIKFYDSPAKQKVYLKQLSSIEPFGSLGTSSKAVVTFLSERISIQRTRRS